MSAGGVYIALVGSIEVGRSDMLVLAQTRCILNAPRGAEQSIHMVRHEPSGQQWIWRELHGEWSWHKINAARPAARQRFADEASRDGLGRRDRHVDPDRWPIPRFRADLDG